jgi:hypothetical protein
LGGLCHNIMQEVGLTPWRTPDWTNGTIARAVPRRTGRHDPGGGKLSSVYPDFTIVGGKTLVDFMVTHALEYVQIFHGEEIMEIRPGAPMEVLVYVIGKPVPSFLQKCSSAT